MISNGKKEPNYINPSTSQTHENDITERSVMRHTAKYFKYISNTNTQNINLLTNKYRTTRKYMCCLGMKFIKYTKMYATERSRI